MHFAAGRGLTITIFKGARKRLAERGCRLLKSSAFDYSPDSWYDSLKVLLQGRHIARSRSGIDLDEPFQREWHIKQALVYARPET